MPTLPPCLLLAFQLEQQGTPPPAGGSAEPAPPAQVAAAETGPPASAQAQALGGVLAAGSALGADELDWGGWLRLAGEWNSFDGAGESRGVEVSDLRLWTDGSAAGLAWRASLEAGLGEVELADLWVRNPLDGRHDFYFGRFRTPFLRSGFIEENRLLFSERTPQGEANDRFEEGLKLVGNYPAFSLEMALQNSTDQAEDALRGTLRADVHLAGSGVPATEQLYGAPRASGATLGLAATDDGTLERGDSYAIDFTYRGRGQFVHAELIDQAASLGGGNPLALTYGGMLTEDLVELGARLFDQDDDAGTWGIGLVFNRYMIRDLAELQFSVEQLSSDDPATDGLRLRLALLLDL
jgi:hypothetical protein